VLAHFRKTKEEEGPNAGTNAAKSLKVPKRQNFSLAFFALCEPIWVCDLHMVWGKIEFFIK
jgi:hypothetical protein